MDNGKQFLLTYNNNRNSSQCQILMYYQLEELIYIKVQQLVRSNFIVQQRMDLVHQTHSSQQSLTKRITIKIV